MLKFTITVEPWKSDSALPSEPPWLAALQTLLEAVRATPASSTAAPISGSPPSSSASVDEATRIEEDLYEGAEAFGKLVATWLQNFAVEGAPQPDRISALMGAFTFHGRVVGAYIRERGGLVGACVDSIVQRNLAHPEAAVLLGKKIALNMVQIGSTMAVPLDELLERSMYQVPRGENGFPVPLDNEMPKPGIARDTLSFERPSEMPQLKVG